MLKRLFFLLFVVLTASLQSQITLPIEVFGLPYDVPETSVGSSLGLKLEITKVSFNLDASTLSSISSTGKGLYLQVNNLSYNKKAAIHVNQGEAEETGWIVLDQGRDDLTGVTGASNVEIYHQEQARGGMVHGGYNTIRLKVNDVTQSNFKEGLNTIEFRFERSDGISSGYRVVDLDLLDASGNNRILGKGSSYFTEDDPLTWTDPYTEDGIALTTQQLQDSIDAGKDLWYYGRGGDFASKTMGADMWSNYLPTDKTGFWYGYDLGESKKMKAKCTNCHTQDGRDLEIFAYSNKSIIERAKFHRLTNKEGRQIAAYIRSLSATDGNKGNIHRYGRPWNPPYQPGTSLAGKPIDEWAAGAGLDAVLESDKDMAKYLFGKPSGFTQADMDTYFDSKKKYETYTLPLPIQFPDWKHWLPMIHPMDAYTKNDFYQSTKSGVINYNQDGDLKLRESDLNPEKGYEKYRSRFENVAQELSPGVYKVDLGSLPEEEIDTLMKGHVEHRLHYRFFQAQDSRITNEDMGGHWRTSTGEGLESVTAGVPQTFAATSMARLMAVKNFELTNEFGLQDQAPNYLETEDNPSNRQWFIADYDGKHVFEVSPHITGCQDEGSCNNFKGQPKATGQYESTNWYQLQMVLTPGYGTNYGNGPVDFNYQPPFILNSSSSSGILQPLRYFHTMNNAYQVKTNQTKDVDPNDNFGFRLRVLGPWHYLGKANRGSKGTFGGHAPLSFVKSLNVDGNPRLLSYIVNAGFKQFLREMDKPQNRFYINDDGDYSHANEHWWRFDSDELKFADRPNGPVRGGNFSQSLDPRDKTDILDLTESFFVADTPHYADSMYWTLVAAQEIEGIDCELLTRMKNWSREAWPNVNKFIVKTNARVVSEKEISWDNILTSCVNDAPFADGSKVSIFAKGSKKHLTIGSEVSTDASLVAKEVPSVLEEFVLEKRGDQYNIKSNSSIKYLSSENTNDPARINRPTAGAWEKFFIEHLGGDEYAIKYAKADGTSKYLSYDTYANGTPGDDALSFSNQFIRANEVFVIKDFNSLSIDSEILRSRSLYIASNPVASVLTLENVLYDYTASVYNYQGQNMLKTSVSSSNHTIDISELSSGNYILMLKGEANNKVIKFIKK